MNKSTLFNENSFRHGGAGVGAELRGSAILPSLATLTYQIALRPAARIFLRNNIFQPAAGNARPWPGGIAQETVECGQLWSR
jgi:hypothetical protein